MERTRLAKLIGVAMVGLGLVQTGMGAMQDEHLFAILGVAYAVIGVAYFLFEGYTGEQ